MSVINNTPRRRSFGSWLLRNVALAIGIVVVFVLIPSGTTMQWLWYSYCKKNLSYVQSHPHASFDERMIAKLGADYKFLTAVREGTPVNSILYYPTKGDFTTPPKGMPRSPFTGKIIDKLAAVRVLYPRRIITVDEWGKTLWAAHTTHVIVVNGFNRNKLPYRVGEDFVIGVLPTNPQELMEEIERKNKEAAASQSASQQSQGPAAIH